MIELLLVFLATVFVDWLWGVYILHTSKRNVWRSSIYATLIAIIGPLLTLTYIKNKYAIVAMALGAFVGTFISVKFGKKND